MTQQIEAADQLQEERAVEVGEVVVETRHRIDGRRRRIHFNAKLVWLNELDGTLSTSPQSSASLTDFVLISTDL